MRISLITAVYNNAEGLRASLTSNLQQTHSDVERIVVDGASKDATLDVLNEHAPVLHHVISEPDQGIYNALNKGLRLATGDVLGLLHSDDLFASPNVLHNVAEAFVKTNADLVYGDLCYVRQEDTAQIVRYWKAGDFERDKLTRGWMPPHPTVYVRRELYERFGGYDEQYRIAADYDWMLRLLLQPDLTVAYLPKILVNMRTGGASNRSLKNLWDKSREDYRILNQHQLNGAATLFYKNVGKLSQFWKRPAAATL
jgi:glycosyltransferase